MTTEIITTTRWTDLDLFRLDGGEQVDVRSAEGACALRELREYGSMAGYVLVDPADYEADGRAAGDEPDLWDAGPRLDAIDWTGSEEVFYAEEIAESVDGHLLGTEQAIDADSSADEVIGEDSWQSPVATISDRAWRGLCRAEVARRIEQVRIAAAD